MLKKYKKTILRVKKYIKKKIRKMVLKNDYSNLLILTLYLIITLLKK